MEIKFLNLILNLFGLTDIPTWEWDEEYKGYRPVYGWHISKTMEEVI